MQSVVSVDNRDRIVSLDILRGIALLGIALVNVLGFNASFFDFGGFYNRIPDPVQQSFYQGFISLTADKFIFLYSFLFGYGFSIQYKKYSSKGSTFTQYYIRRLFFLALFGIGHIIFLWAGDILLTYSIAGFILFVFRKLPSNILLILGLFFYFFISFWLIVANWLPLPNALSSTCTECLSEALQIYPTGNYMEILKLRLYEYFSFLNINLFYYMPKVIGVFIFGFLASQYNLHKRIEAHPNKWWTIFMLVAVLACILYFYYEICVFNILPPDNIYSTALYMGAYELMNLFIAYAYILLILLIASYKQIILKPFAFAGRMSLSNYIIQSVLFSIIFYGWGLGKFGMQEISNVVLYAVGVFILQLFLSYVWLKYYKRGPLEWLWRRLSYGRWV